MEQNNEKCPVGIYSHILVRPLYFAPSLPPLPQHSCFLFYCLFSLFSQHRWNYPSHKLPHCYTPLSFFSKSFACLILRNAFLSLCFSEHWDAQIPSVPLQLHVRCKNVCKCSPHRTETNCVKRSERWRWISSIRKAVDLLWYILEMHWYGHFWLIPIIELQTRLRIDAAHAAAAVVTQGGLFLCCGWGPFVSSSTCTMPTHS